MVSQHQHKRIEQKAISGKQFSRQLLMFTRSHFSKDRLPIKTLAVTYTNKMRVNVPTGSHQQHHILTNLSLRLGPWTWSNPELF